MAETHYCPFVQNKGTLYLKWIATKKYKSKQMFIFEKKGKHNIAIRKHKIHQAFKNASNFHESRHQTNSTVSVSGGWMLEAFDHHGPGFESHLGPKLTIQIKFPVLT